VDIQITIQTIREHLIKTFDSIDLWFDQNPEIRQFKPERDNTWTIDQVLEHIALTNHFLLILIEKGARKALNLAVSLDFATALEDYRFEPNKFDKIGQLKSFEWMRPDHMEPKGEKSSEEVRQQLNAQLNQCLTILDLLKNGEGILYKTTMTVDKLGKIDVYEYLYFLAQHGQRHILQMERIKSLRVIKP
jgi:DinB superfamily